MVGCQQTLFNDRPNLVWEKGSSWTQELEGLSRGKKSSPVLCDLGEENQNQDWKEVMGRGAHPIYRLVALRSFWNVESNQYCYSYFRR